MRTAMSVSSRLPGSRWRARNHRASTDRAVWWCHPTHPRVSYSSSPHSPLAFWKSCSIDHRFDRIDELIAVFPDGSRRRLALEGNWPHGDRVVLKFKGFDSPEEASALKGCELAVPESEAVELEEGEFYDWQLQGCRVETVEGVEVGTVREVLHTGGEAPVLVTRDGRGVENLIPLAESICVEIDVESKLIRVDAPEGLLEGE